MKTGEDYMRFSAKLRGAMAPHVELLLAAGVSVVLDYPANTVAQRRWMQSLVECSNQSHQMHVLDVPDAVCLARLRARNASGTHPFSVTDAQFFRFAAHFVPPRPVEGFNVIQHRAAG